MTSLRFSFVFLFALGFICLTNGNPISNFFGKSSDDKAEADDKTTVTTASTAKSAAETTTTTATTTTPEPGSACGGLKGFLHICDKNPPTEPPKSIKKRSASEEDDSDEDEDDNSNSEDDDDDDDDDDNDSDEKTNNEERKQNTETSPVSSEPTEGGIAKRQVGDPEAPVLGEVPPVIADAMNVPEKPEEDKDVNKRQADDSNSDSDEDDEDLDRKRRDCRDQEGDYYKDCRRKREYVPTCFGPNCKLNETLAADE